MKKDILVRWLTGTLALLSLLTLVSCSGAAAQDAQSRSTQPVKVAATHTWETISLPVAGQPLSDYAVAPGDARTVYACLKEDAAQFTLWRTRDAGQHWSRLPFPSTAGRGCSLSLTPDQPQRIAVLLKNVADSQQPCSPVSLYVSGDGGQSWQHRTPEMGELAHKQVEDCQVAVTAHHIYLWYTYGGGQAAPQSSLLARSDDNGSSWSRADTALGADSLFLMPRIGRDESLTVIARPVSDSSSQLWRSHDGGRSWLREVGLPDQVGGYLQQSPASSTPLYALANEQLPSNLYRLQLLQSLDGQRWSTLPALPVAGTGTAQSGLLQALAVTDSGQLLAFGVDPTTGIFPRSHAPQPTTSFWLWTWDPNVQQWQVITTPLHYTANETCGLCWNAQLAHGVQQDSYLYVYHQDDQQHMFRLHIP